MAQVNNYRKIGISCAMLLLAFSAVHAEDVEKRFRIGLSVGGYDGRHAIDSDSANVLFLTDEDDRVIQGGVFDDPRNDNAAIGNLEIKSTVRATLTAQYAVSKIFLVQLSAGYQKGTVGEIEVQAQFDGNDPTPPDRFNFTIFRIEAGDLEQVPLKLTALARFRPRASLNPYLGVGVGYTLIGFEPSAALNSLSRNLDASIGTFARLQTFPGTFIVSGQPQDLTGAEVDARDTFEWHLAGGIEYGWRKNWAAFLDLTYSLASRSLSIQFNGSDNLGLPVPNDRAFATDPIAFESFGSMLIQEGGLVDGGRLVPPPSDPDVDCEASVFLCDFVEEPDGQLDTGFYYIQGGSLEYDNVTLHVGVRYTF